MGELYYYILGSDAVDILQGVSWSMIGPSMLDLSDKMGVSIGEIGTVMSANSLAFLVMNFIFGIVVDKYFSHCDLFAFLGLSVRAVALGLTPFSTQLWMFAICHITDAGTDALISIGKF